MCPVSVQGLVQFVQAQDPRAPCSYNLWDPCILADYVRFETGTAIPRTARSPEIEPYLEALSRDGNGKLIEALCEEAIPDTYGELLAFMLDIDSTIVRFLNH